MSLIVYPNYKLSSIPTNAYKKFRGMFLPICNYVSRCNYKPDIFDTTLICRSIDYMKTVKNHGLTWEDLMDKKSQELSNLNGRIYVMYSGGVDSTGIIVSFLKNWSQEDLKKITILCTPASAHEFPEFFNFLTKKFPIQYLEQNLQQYTQDGYLISGMLADLLFVDPTMAQKTLSIDKNILNINYKVHGPTLFKLYNNTYGKEIFERFLPLVEEEIYPIENLLDFTSWLYYTQLWQRVQLAHISQKNNFTDASYYNRVIQFFDDVDFEIWSLFNREQVYLNDNGVFKVIPKSYIVDYLKLDVYRKKEKFPSYLYAIYGTEFNYGIDENWNFLSLSDTMKYLKAPGDV